MGNHESGLGILGVFAPAMLKYVRRLPFNKKIVMLSGAGKVPRFQTRSLAIFSRSSEICAIQSGGHKLQP